MSNKTEISEDGREIVLENNVRVFADTRKPLVNHTGGYWWNWDGEVAAIPRQWRNCN